ncbi:MAG: DEAD/DEAH box helicase [Candidatus Pacearchaeota archaeon]
MIFENLNLSEKAQKTVASLDFEESTEIQKKSIPEILEGKDVLGKSATGSGKTLAFGLGIVEKVEHGRGVQALVLAPTRELAKQVSSFISEYSKELNMVSVYGGANIDPQIEALETADVVVGTPGRILDHIERQTLNLRNVDILVLDEADRMLDMGFVEDIENIMEECPEKRQTLLFSATVPYELEKISEKYMDNPVKIEAESQVDPLKLEQVYYDISPQSKFSLLAHLLKESPEGAKMVFANTRKTTDLVARNLSKHGFKALAIHGGLSQAQRDSVMKKFHDGNLDVLVCTDVAARGLDINDVSQVYNYDIPPTIDDYTHRIGRTARAGKEGKAINLVSNRDYDNFRNIMSNKDFNIEERNVPEMEYLQVNFKDESKDKKGSGPKGSKRGRKGRSKDRHNPTKDKKRSFNSKRR